MTFNVNTGYYNILPKYATINLLKINVKNMDENTRENNIENTAPINSPGTTGFNQNQIAGAIVIAGLIIAGAIMLKGSSAPSGTNTASNNTKPVALEGRPISDDDHIVGNKNAKVIILEYSDLECPFCKVFHNTMRKVVAGNSDIAWVYRHYPIPQLHSKAPYEAEATECAWEQGGNDAFWKYIDRVFEVTTSNDGLPETELPKIAEYVGLNVTQFIDCLSSGKYTAKVQADVADGQKMGVNGTPSSFMIMKGKVIPFITQDGTARKNIPGAQSYEAVMQNIERILK
jgi:protein-disulfide isomerase